MNARQLWRVLTAPLTPGAKLVLQVLLLRLGDNAHCWPSQESIAVDTGQAERCVRRHLKQLEAAGLVERRRRRRKDGSRTTDAYVPHVEGLTRAQAEDASTCGMLPPRLIWQTLAADVTHGAKLTLQALLLRFGNNDHCWPSHQRLAMDTGQTDRAVRAQLRQLEDVGIITRKPRRRLDGRRTTDAYFVDLEALKPEWLRGLPEKMSGRPTSGERLGRIDGQPPSTLPRKIALGGGPGRVGEGRGGSQPDNSSAPEGFHLVGSLKPRFSRGAVVDGRALPQERGYYRPRPSPSKASHGSAGEEGASPLTARLRSAPARASPRGRG